MITRKQVLSKKIEAILNKKLEEKLHKIGQLVVNKARLILEGNIGRPTKLADDIKYRIEGNTVIVYTTSEVAAYLEYGTKPHVIKPKNAKALKFRTEQTVVGKNGKKYEFGDVVLAKIVHHPGFSPRPFFYLAFKLSKKEIENIIKK